MGYGGSLACDLVRSQPVVILAGAGITRWRVWKSSVTNKIGFRWTLCNGLIG